MLSRVSITNFKSIGEPGVDLVLKPLTLLVGPNGGGKSSVLEAICVVAQRSSGGNLVRFRSSESLLHKGPTSSASITVHFGPDARPSKGAVKIVITASGGLNVEYPSTNTERAQLAIQSFDKLSSNALFLSSVRGSIPYAQGTGADPDWVNVHGESLLLILAKIFGQRQHKSVEEKVTKWAARFGLGEINAGFVGSNEAGSDYLDSELDTVLNLALSSSGSKQILTIITQLFWAPEGSLLMIEEPEISLHPKAQVDVLEMFSEGIKENKQVIATTHSISMLQALGYSVLKGWLTRDQIAVYHVEKGAQGTTATALPLDENGYIKDWVPSFTEVERQLLAEWAKSVPRE